jgi:tRNA (adenine57-N1/adenine58-N1)-methyltransferase
MGPESIVGEAGTGSGAAACYFARIVRQVYSFDVVPEHVALGQANAKALGLENVSFATHDIYTGIPAPSEGEYSVFVLDNPEPWNALPYLRDRIAIGGWIVGYLPSINQTATFANALQEAEGFQYRKTVELIEREWAVKGMRVRPSSDAIGHTGFLVFARRIC